MYHIYGCIQNNPSQSVKIGLELASAFRVDRREIGDAEAVAVHVGDIDVAAVRAHVFRDVLYGERLLDVADLHVKIEMPHLLLDG